MNPSDDALPPGLLLAYYGDDFTGSTDAMEAFAVAGIPTVLFLDTPTPALLARFPEARCVGLAGASRSRDPAWMRGHLGPAFASLAALEPPLLQYKVCSTFDSSPDTGSIGCAIDLGVAAMGGRHSAMIVGAPRLNRYQVFGNLFAVAGGAGYRLDRHPTMARHPVTPMGEADLRRHLGEQTSRRIELVDLPTSKRGAAGERLRELGGGDAPVVLFDVCDDDTLRSAGQAVWQERAAGRFTASSSGLQYALVAHWRAQGLLPEAAPLLPAEPVPAVAVVSGSCSPGTAEQIAHARAAGFHVERLNVGSLLRAADAEIERAIRAGVQALADGVSVVVCSAEGPDDPAVAGFDTLATVAGLGRREAAAQVGVALAAIMRGLLDRSALRRVVVAGGDSSGAVAGMLGIQALTVHAPLAPGAPICRAWSADPARDGLQIVLKGGQVGGPAFFSEARAGRPMPPP
jgi:uncharacterized protein YgbK (DUF1537 family)